MANRNLSQLRGEVYLRLAESGSGFYTDDEINQWLNDGVRNVAVNLEPLMTTATATTTADTGEYTLESDALSIRSVFWLSTSGVWQSLNPTTWEQLFVDNPDWENDTSGVPADWYWRQNAIGLHPAPSAANAGTDTLRVLYTYLPAAMSDDAATTGMPEYLDDAVILYAVIKGYQKDRSFDKANAIAQEYTRRVSEGELKLARHKKQTAPRMIPDMAPYRSFYLKRGRPGFIRVQDS